MEIELRDYQEELYNNVKYGFSDGTKGICCVLPCRSGKSFIMAKIAKDGSKKGNVLILAHRNTLLDQHRELFYKLKLENYNIRIESVFTEINHLGENGDVNLILIDEGHLSGAKSYQKVCEYYNCRVILFTATPARLDGKPLNLAQKMIEGISIKELIKRNCVSDFDYYAPELDINYKDVKKTGGDYNNKEIGEKVMTKKIYGDILKYYNKLGENRQAVAYCVNIEHSKEVCEMFNENGISSKHMDSKTPEKERAIIMEEFKQNKFTILCNCNLISEGITLPTASVGLLLRPTLSLPLYIQQACRVLTPMENKKAIIIDYVGNVFEHGMITNDRKWSLDSKVEKFENVDEEGEFLIRTCLECYSTFEKANICPFCGAPYEMTSIEIQNIKEVELKKINEEKEKRRQEYNEKIKDNIKEYQNIKECKNWVELIHFCKKKGYKPGYAFVYAKNNNIDIPKKRK